MKLPKKLKNRLDEVTKGLKVKHITIAGKPEKNMEGVCPICNKKLVTRDKTKYVCHDGTMSYLRLFLGNKKMDGIYFCHKECYFTLYKCIAATIDTYGIDYAVYDI